MADRLEKLEQEVIRLRGLCERLVTGLSWFMDPPEQEEPEEPDPKPEKPKRVDPANDFGNAERLRKLRPKAYRMGQEAYLGGNHKNANPYKDTRGGFRNAWFHGWQETHDEQEVERPDP